MAAGSRPSARAPFDGERRLISQMIASRPSGRRRAPAKSGPAGPRPAPPPGAGSAPAAGRARARRLVARISSRIAPTGRAVYGPAACARLCRFVPGRLPVGHGHGGAPGRGRQHAQRLVGVGAHPGLALRRVLGRRHRPLWHRWPDDLALLADLGFGAYRFSLEWSRIEPAEGEFSVAALDHYRRMLAACHEVGCCRSSRSTTSPRPAGRWPTAGGSRRARPSGWPGSASGPSTTSATSSGWLHDQRAERGGLGRLPVRRIPARPPRPGRVPPGQRRDAAGVPAGPRRGGRGPGRLPGRRHPVDARLQGAAGGEAHVAEARTMLEDAFLEQARRRRVPRRAVLHAPALRARRDGRPGRGVPTTIMGYEFWPRCVEVAVRRAAEVTGIPVYVTENGIATADDAERVRYVTEALAGVRRCLDDGIDVRGYLYWSPSTTSSGPGGTPQRSASSASTARRSPVSRSPRRSGWARWPARTACRPPDGCFTKPSHPAPILLPCSHRTGPPSPARDDLPTWGRRAQHQGHHRGGRGRAEHRRPRRDVPPQGGLPRHPGRHRRGRAEGRAHQRPQLVVLDVGLPDVDGLEVCRRLRADTTVPIVFLTARDDEIDRILGLEMGADDA